MLAIVSLAVMSQAETLSVMNRLLAILYRSLPLYLHDAQPWHGKRQEDERAAKVLNLIVAEQRSLSEHVAEFILDHGGEPNPGAYPLEFSDANWHFVGLEYLLHPLIQHQKIDI